SLYGFSYIFIVMNEHHLQLYQWVEKIILCSISFVLFSTILFMKHRNKHKEISVFTAIKGDNFFQKRNIWLINLAIGISSVFLVSKYILLNRYMWVCFAFSSLLSSYTANIKERFIDRLLGVIIGSFLFGIVSFIVPVSALGIIGGLALGFCGTYK